MKTKKLVCYNCGGHGFITTIYESGQTSTICPVCGGIGTHEIQMTNADRIRAMSDEELATFISEIADECERNTECNQHCYGCDIEYCVRESCLNWLHQPAEEDDYVA